MKKKILTVLISLTMLSIVVASPAFADQNEVVVEEWKIPFLNCLTGAIASIGE